VRPLIAALLLVLLAVPAVAQPDVPEIARGLLEAGDQAKKARRYSEAISSYERALAVAPRLTRAYISLGAIYFEQGKADEAYDVLMRGVQRANPERTLFANAAAAAQQLGKSSEALGLIDRALALERRDAALLALRATILRSLQRNDDALTAILEAAKADPKDPRYQLSAGNLLLSMGRTAEATTAYRAAVTLDKSLLRAWLNLGAIYQKQRLWQPATEAYENVVRLAPNDVSAHYNLGQLYYTTNQRERAEEEYRKALAKDASLPLAYLHLGELALGRKEYEKAAQLLAAGMPYYDAESKTLATQTLESAQLALARIARQQQRYADAKSLLDRIPRTPASLLERVLVTRAMNDLPGERAALEELLKTAPAGEPALRSELALVQLRLGDVDAARANAAALPPLTRAVLTRDAAALGAMTSPIARGDAGLLLWEGGRGAQAKPHLLAAHAAIPDWPEVTLALGDLAIADRQFGDAIDLLSTA
jgi:tetratricopeptide (TPR) repeat protein